MKKVNFVLFHSFERNWFVKSKEELKKLNTHIIKLITEFKNNSLFQNYDFEFKFLSIIKNYKLNHENNILLKTYKVNIFKKLIPLEFSFSLLKEITKISKKVQNIWHLNTYYYLMFDFVVPLLKFKKQKIIAHHRGGGFTWKSSPYTFFQYYLILPFLLRLVDKIIVQNTYERDRLINVYKLNKNKIVWIPNGVDTDFFKPLTQIKKDEFRNELNIRKEDFVILWVGRLEKSKGANILPLLVSELTKKKINFKLIIVGDGPERNKLILTFENFNNIYFSNGQVSKKELKNYFGIADLFIHTNTNKNYEGSPNVILEAQASGLAAIGFDIPGVQDSIVNGKTGYLIRNKNYVDYIKKLIYLYNEKNVLKFMNENSRNNIYKNFNIKKLVKKYYDIYEEVYEK